MKPERAGTVLTDSNLGPITVAKEHFSIYLFRPDITYLNVSIDKALLLLFAEPDGAGGTGDCRPYQRESYYLALVGHYPKEVASVMKLLIFS